MEIRSRLQRGVLYLDLIGEIDEHSAQDARVKADMLIDGNVQATAVVFGLKEVSFMDSTGIGFLIGRYKKIKRYGIEAFVADPNKTADKILTLSGVYTLIPKINKGGSV